MLGFRWIATHAGAPASDDFKAAFDSIRTQDGATELQAVPKDPAIPVEPSQALVDAVEAWMERRGNSGPVVLLVHGYDYDPQKIYDPLSEDDAFNRVYANPAAEKFPLESWLPIVGETTDQGAPAIDKAVAFCWTSGGSISHYASAGWSNSYQYAVLDLAVQAARSLALVVMALRQAGAIVDILAHSLGTRLTMQTLGLLAQRNAVDHIRRVVLLGGAEFSVDARDMSAQGAYHIVNLVNRSDEVLTWGAIKMTDPYREVETVPARVIGRDGMPTLARWIDIQIDRAGEDRRAEFDVWFRDTYQTVLSPNGAGGRGRHWGYYMQPGNRAFLKRLFMDGALALEGLRQTGLNGVVRPGYPNLNDPVPPTPQSSADRIKARQKPQDR